MGIKQIDEFMIKKYKLNEAEAEDYIERMGIMVDHSGEDEILSAKNACKAIVKKRMDIKDR